SAYFATKFDLNGEYLWEKQYHTPERNVDPGFIDIAIPLVQGGFAASLTFFASGALTKTYLYRFDNNADTLWTRLIKEDSSLEWNHGTRGIRQLSDTTFLHWGWCEGNVGCISFLDSTGQVLSVQQYSNTHYIFSA